MQRLETLTGQLALVGGERRDHSPLITIAEPDGVLAPEARKGRLYILIEADMDMARTAQACQLAARTLKREFYADTTYSVTSALRAALRAANKAIYEFNIGQPAQQRVQVGCTCAVLKDGELYLAQVQPAQTYIFQAGQLRPIPAHPSWNPAHQSAAPFVHSGALGASLFIEPELFRSDFGAGSRVLICSSRLSRVLRRPDAQRLLEIADPNERIAALAELAGEHAIRELYAVAITVQEAAPKPAPVLRDEQTTKRLAAGGVFGGVLARLRKTGDPSSAAPARSDPLRTLPEEPPYSATPPPRPTPIDLGESLSDRYQRNQRERPRPTPVQAITTAMDVPPSTFLGEADYISTTRSVDLGDGPTITAEARAYRPRYEMRPLVDMDWGERLLLPFRLVAISIEDAWRANRTRRQVPQQRSIPRGRGLSYRRTKPPFPWLMLLSLTTIIAILIGYGVLLSQQNSSRLAEEYLQIAEQRLAEVRAAPNETVALERLDIAGEAIDEVLASPEVTRTNSVLWTRYQELQREYERSLASVQRLTFFDNPTIVARHPLPTGRFSTVVVPTQLSGITDTNILEGLQYIYALDANNTNAQLYRIPRDGGEAETYLAPNQPVGTTVVGPLRAALWRIDQVVAIDAAPSGFGYYFRQGNGWNYSKLGASEIWNASDRLDVEEFFGNLYFWGAQPGEVLKYNSGSYGDAPEFWLQTGGAGENDLSTVVDMAVDGSIYLLQPNGTILVFSVGQVVGTIQPQGLIPPVSTVTRMVVTGPPSEGSIFLLEPLAERIIQIDKTTGEVIQQIKLRSDGELQLNELAGLTVDSSGSRPTLYIINGGQVIRSDLPAPPRSFFEETDDPTP